MIKDIIERSALLIALGYSYPNGVEVNKLNLVLPTWRSHVEFLRKKGIDIEVNEYNVMLKAVVYYDLYQSIPPEIRNDVENILWKIIPKPPIIDITGMKQMVIQPIKTVIKALASKPSPSNDEIDNYGIKWLIRNGKRFPLACFHCYNAQCLTYGIEAFSPTDAFPSLVCPADAIKQSQEGIVSINESSCSGCMLCIIRCPINAIFSKNGVAVKREYADLPSHDRYISKGFIQIEEKQKVTEDILAKLGAVCTPLRLGADALEILNNFDDKISQNKFNWDRDQYYVWVRNCFREMGLEALYTGSGGKLKRADVTIKRPFFAGVEVKSPAEGEISVGAIRQAIDAAREVSDTYRATTYCAVIGKEIARGAHARAESWYNYNRSRVPLIRGRYLLYLILKHKTELPQDPDKDTQRLFKDFHGWFGKEELTEYFKVYFQLRRDELSKGTVSLVMPPKVDKILRCSNKDKATAILRKLENATYGEIERCFPDPERMARGGYAVS